MSGWGAVIFFNKIPPSWLCDYGESTSHKLWAIRIDKYPWAPIFSLAFMIMMYIMWDMGPLYIIAAIFSLWFLLLISISDIKYMIVPDQFVLAISVTAIGFIPFQNGILSSLYGAILGGGSFLVIGLAGKLLLKKEAMGFGDVKLMAAIGLVVGMKGIVIVIIITFFSSGIIMGIGLLRGKLNKESYQPLAPYIAASTAAFILFRLWLLSALNWYLSL
jgi:prepilin signal peptidase PulO-like enzyme (type II secretory pathway)